MDLEDVGAAQEARRPRAPRRRLPAVLAGEFAGDNFIRISGDTVNHAKSQMFKVWKERFLLNQWHLMDEKMPNRVGYRRLLE